MSKDKRAENLSRIVLTFTVIRNQKKRKKIKIKNKKEGALYDRCIFPDASVTPTARTL